jgi:hypothetical protein
MIKIETVFNFNIMSKKNVVLLLPRGIVPFQSKTALYGSKNGLLGDKRYKG